MKAVHGNSVVMAAIPMVVGRWRVQSPPLPTSPHSSSAQAVCWSLVLIRLLASESAPLADPLATRYHQLLSQGTKCHSQWNLILAQPSCWIGWRSSLHRLLCIIILLSLSVGAIVKHNWSWAFDYVVNYIWFWWLRQGSPLLTSDWSAVDGHCLWYSNIMLTNWAQINYCKCLLFSLVISFFCISIGATRHSW